MKEKKSPFISFNNCLKNYAYDSDLPFVSFMFCRFLGNNLNMINYANFINCYSGVLSDESQFRMIQSIKNKPRNIGWIKNEKSEIPEIIDEIANNYKISHKKAREYNEILEMKGMQNDKN